MSLSLQSFFTFTQSCKLTFISSISSISCCVISGRSRSISVRLPQGTYTLELRNIRITDDSGGVHAQGNTSCAILVCDATRGDLNGDGAVDYEDLSLMRDIVLGMGKDGREVADLNGDGAVDGADLVRLSRAILGFVDLDE